MPLHVVPTAAVRHILMREPLFGGLQMPFEQLLDVGSDRVENFLLVHKAQPTDQ
jgi:hypothetical protein